MLAASELLKALKEDENTEVHKDSNDDYDFGSRNHAWFGNMAG